MNRRFCGMCSRKGSVSAISAMRMWRIFEVEIRSSSTSTSSFSILPFARSAR